MVTNDCSGITIVVGASSGIGRSLACALGRQRRCVVVVGRRQDALERVANDITAFGGTAVWAVSDTRDKDSIAVVLDEILAGGARIDAVYLSQGIAQSIADMEQFTTTELREIIETNVMGVANWLEALQPILARQDGESVVAVLSSLAAYRAIPGAGAAYAASKAAISQLCHGLRGAWGRQGIRLVTVEPGFVRTPMTRNIPFMPLLMEPEDAAEIILKGVREDRAVIRFPTLAAWTIIALAHVPPKWVDRLSPAQKDSNAT